MRITRQRVIDKLNQIIHSERGTRTLQEPLIVERSGRFVLPVKADFKGQMRGIVHDQSASGATLFIEPLGVVELANAWRQAQLEEADEIERILRALSAQVGGRGGHAGGARWTCWPRSTWRWPRARQPRPPMPPSRRWAWPGPTTEGTCFLLQRPPSAAHRRASCRSPSSWAAASASC